LTAIEDLSLARVTAWPAQRARELLAAPDWRERIAALLRDDEAFRTAVLLASRGLRGAVERALRGEPLEAREATRLLAYAVRMATRTTPFGIFASVGPLVFGEGEARVGALGERVARANVDHEWLVGAVDAAVERALDAGEEIVLVTATALRREGPRFALLDERKVNRDGDAAQYRSVTIAARPAVASALELARDGVSSAALARTLAERFTVEPDAARALVRNLVAARFLIPAARPAPLDDARERIAAFASAQPSLAPVAAALRDAPESRRGLPDAAALDAAVRRLASAGPSDVQQPVFFDVTHDALALPALVREDVLRLADVLMRSGVREHLGAYRERFIARYESSERLVPLLELVGPHGLGIPGDTEVERTPPGRPRRARLAALIGAALRAGNDEIALSDDDWDAIRRDLPDPPPPSLEVAFNVLAPSYDAIASGAYRIVSSPLVGAPGAGKTTGRFVKYQSAAFGARLRETVAAEAPPGAITAEPLFVAERARTGNVIAHPVIAETVIPINAHAGGLDALALDDLLAGIAGDRIALWSRSRNRRVHVVWPHAFNPQLAPPLARFFAFVARDGGHVPAPFDLGELALLPFVPRLRLGRVVLRRATWTFTAGELRARGLAALARELRLPPYTLYGEADEVLAIDTRSEAGDALLRDQTRANAPADPVLLAEAAIGKEDLWLRDASGENYPAEIVVSVRSTAPRAAVRPVRVVVDEGARRRTPASEWSYVKLYANDREFRAQLAPRLLHFGDEAIASGLAAEWFYILYGDPDRHVRLRLRSGADGRALRERVLAFAEELTEAGIVSRYALATYERELERYGGAEGLALCERLFHLDSVEALRAPGADLLSGRERLDALAPPLLRLFDALTSAYERERWIETRRPAAKPATREEGETLRALARRAAPDEADERVALGRAVAACCGETDAYLGVVDSLMHMHLNRRGVGRDEETALYRLLWKALFARRSREKAAS
jgi:thiopeptide-type bacteriocin biosynthesis protein